MGTESNPTIGATTTAAPGTGGTPILEFDGISLAPAWRYDVGLDDATFALRPGELILVALEAGHTRPPLADLAMGLVEPHAGAVRFAGRRWTALSAPSAARARAGVRRVFEAAGWVSNLDLDENILLAAEHHGAGSPDALHRQADELARDFGLDGLPHKRPAAAAPRELRLAQWVRAVLGEPKLILLERPTRDVPAAAVPPLLRHLAAARARGAAVLWTTSEPDVLDRHAAPGTAPTARYRMRGPRMEKETLNDER